MKLVWLQKLIPSQYSQLLAVIILLLLIAPIVEGKSGQILLAVVFLGTIISIIRTFNLKKRFFLPLLILAGTSFSLELYTKLQGDFTRKKFLVLMIMVVYSLFLLAAVVTINRTIFSVKKVDGDTIKGGISVFFLIGIAWSLFYSIVYILDANAFSKSIEAIDLRESMLYFSFTTLTTLGYGDITPVSDIARNLANLEAITGMLYPSIFIARLVGLYTAQEMSHDD